MRQTLHALSRRLVRVYRCSDRWLERIGSSCCAGRSMRQLDRTVQKRTREPRC